MKKTIVKHKNVCYTARMKKNDIVQVEIEDFGMNGQGVGKVQGQVIFVPYAIIGEIHEVVIIYVAKSFCVGKTLQILKKSAVRQQPKCMYYHQCGGCTLQHIKYEHTLQYKRAEVQKAFDTIAKQSISVLPTVPSESIYEYRNKAAFPIAMVQGSVVMGMYRAGTHVVVPIERCILQHPAIHKVMEIFCTWANQANLTVYTEATHFGLLRYLVVRVVGNGVLVCVVVNGSFVPQIQALYTALKQEFEEVGLSININTQKTNVILNQTGFVQIAGKEQLCGEAFGITFPISSGSFMQINESIRNCIYQKVLQQVQAYMSVIDAYAGAGLLTSMCAKRVKQAYGIEIIPQAVQNANALAESNGLTNVQNICGDVVEVLPKLVKKVNAQECAIILDPPRKGCEPKVMQTVASFAPEKIVYVSCNPQTLARDIQEFFKSAKQKYTLQFVQPYDMFPQTGHVEMVAVLVKKQK